MMRNTGGKAIMLKFEVYNNGKPATEVDLNGAHLVGSDNVPIKADIVFAAGQVRCQKRAGGPSSLCLLWPVPGFGKVLLETSKVQEREKPHNLNMELARGRLMRIAQKREDWGLFDYEGTDRIAELINKAQEKFIESLKLSDDGCKASLLADESLKLSCRGGEMLTAFHADLLLQRRQTTKNMPKRMYGTMLDLAGFNNEDYRTRLLESSDFVHIPLFWRLVEPKEQEFNWDVFDQWVEWLSTNRIPMKGGPLVCFNDYCVPDWIRTWEQDFDQLRVMVHDHLHRVVQRYGQYIKMWDVISGIHAENALAFNFEQIIELTRMSSTLVKQASPRCMTIIDMIQPWGEYYAYNTRTIPPMLYADMCVQSGIKFDAFGLQVYFGQADSGYYVRDMLQISTMLDRFAGMGKPLHVSAVQVPSAVTPDPRDAWGGRVPVEGGGFWHERWSENVQKEWLENFYQVAFAKPFVESVSWRDLSDQSAHHLSHGGLLNGKSRPKPAYTALLNFRQTWSKPA